MYRNLFRFLKDKINVSWKMIGRLSLLAVYGEEHEADGVYPIAKKLSMVHFAKRKFFNILKPVELLFTAISLSLNKLIGVGDKKLSFGKSLGFGFKLMLVDLPLGILKLVSAPANFIIRRIKNAIQDWGAPNKVKAVVFPWMPKPQNPQNNISRFLFNSHKNADTFPLHKMNTRYVLLSFVGGDPSCPPEDPIAAARIRVADAANYTHQLAGQVENLAGNVQQTAIAASASAAGAASVLPAPFSSALFSVASGAAAVGGAAVGVKSAANMTSKVAKQIEMQIRPGK